MVHSYLEGKTEESRELFFKYFDLVKTVMSADVNPVGIKAALALRGQIAEELRLPLVPISPEAGKISGNKWRATDFCPSPGKNDENQPRGFRRHGPHRAAPSWNWRFGIPILRLPELWNLLPIT